MLLGYRIAERSTKYYYCFRFFAPGMYDTTYSNMLKYAAFGRRTYTFFVLTRLFARFKQSYTLEASLQMFWKQHSFPGKLSQKLYGAQMTEGITEYKFPPFFLLYFFKYSHITHIIYVFCHFCPFLKIFLAFYTFTNVAPGELGWGCLLYVFVKGPL